MSKPEVAIVGIGIHPFGRTPERTGQEQGVYAVREALIEDKPIIATALKTLICIGANLRAPTVIVSALIYQLASTAICAICAESTGTESSTHWVIASPIIGVDTRV